MQSITNDLIQYTKSSKGRVTKTSWFATIFCAWEVMDMFDENSSMLINRWSRLIFFELLTSAFYSDDSFFMPSWVAISGHHSEQKPSENFRAVPKSIDTRI